MIKVISKKRYEDLIEMIDIQNRQISSLIKLVDDNQNKTNKMLETVCRMVEYMDIRNDILPPEGKEILEKILYED